MSETRDAFGPLLARLQADMRAVQRQMAVLQAGQAQLPTLDQFQAGLSEIDKQFAALGDVIAEKITAAIGGHLSGIAARLDSIEKQLEHRP